MYFYGSFLTQLDETVTVHIVTENSRAKQVEIGDEKSGVFFTTNPVEIESSVNDTFDHLLRSQATIRLLTRDFIPDLFCTSCMDAVVNIFKGGKCVFAGFIEPQAYSQGYNDNYDELEISCIDVLSALQYSNYRNVGALGAVYEAVRADATQRTFADILGDILTGACAALDITGAGGVQYYFDGSKAASSNRYGIFSDLSISELLFLGAEEDDVWKQDKVLESILKYLNLHIVQDGLQFYIFSWESVKSDSAIVWHEQTTGAAKTTTKNCITFDVDKVASDDTTISIGEVYNQILLTCKVESIEDIIESPLDGGALVSPYTNKQKYLTEYSADGNGTTAYNDFFNMLHNIGTIAEGSAITDWYIQVKNNPHWLFPEASTGASLIDKYCQNNANQQALPNHMPEAACTALVSLGKVERKSAYEDNAPVAKVEMSDYLVVSVNGNGKDGAQGAYPTEASLRDSAPCAVYNGAVTGGIYSPSDDSTTNYIVLSGKIVLNPIMDFTGDYKALHNANSRDDQPWVDAWHNTVPSRNNDDGRYYTQQYFKAATPFVKPEWDENTARGLVPFTGTGPQLYEFKYSAIGDGTGSSLDMVSKVAVLACMLIIGDKCAVETGKSGRVNDIVWKTYKPREQCANDDEYYQQCFTIGFDPKIGDKLIGTEFDFQNNISIEMGIDAEGIAIPVKRNTKLSGAVRFMILGPVNTRWGEITRRHSTWFRSVKYYENSVPLLAHVSSIFLKEFEIKIYSDNGLINNTGDNDIVYMSDTREKFVNRKDDIEFEINSALTSEECRQLGVTDTVKLSTPLDHSTGIGVRMIYDYNNTPPLAKPEQLYVNSYYTEYHKPRIQMSQKLDDREEIVGLFNHYKHPAMTDKVFYVQGISRNLIEGYAELTLKEVWQYD